MSLDSDSERGKMYVFGGRELPPSVAQCSRVGFGRSWKGVFDIQHYIHVKYLIDQAGT
jgi:hypothetical protein